MAVVVPDKMVIHNYFVDEMEAVTVEHHHILALKQHTWAVVTYNYLCEAHSRKIARQVGLCFLYNKFMLSTETFAPKKSLTLPFTAFNPRRSRINCTKQQKLSLPISPTWTLTTDGNWYRNRKAGSSQLAFCKLSIHHFCRSTKL